MLLSEINEKIVEAKTRLSKVKVNEILVAYADYQGNVEGQQEKKRLIAEWTESISILADKLTELSEKEKRASDLLYEARKAAENNTENREMLSLEQENKDNEAEHNRLVYEASVFSELLSKLSLLKKKLNNIGLTSRAKTLENKIKSLEAGVMCYPDEATFVRDKINEELGQQSKKEDVRLLCELLYMTDDSWQDAVESYLNTQRFNIIVAPENYLIAKKVFISLGDKVKGIGLIDTRRICDISYGEEGEAYLGDKVESENIYAKRYARFVMREVVCCDSADTLEQHGKSVTKDRLRFQNFCLQRMGKREHFIGVDAIAKQLKTARKELVAVQESLGGLTADKKSFDEVYEDYTKFTAGNNFALLEKYCDSECY